MSPGLAIRVVDRLTELEDVPAPGAGQDGYGFEYDHATGAMVWKRHVRKNEVATCHAGAPGAGDGVDGEFRVDYLTNTLYGPKAGGVWPPGVQMPGRLIQFLPIATIASVNNTGSPTAANAYVAIPEAQIVDNFDGGPCVATFWMTQVTNSAPGATTSVMKMQLDGVDLTGGVHTIGVQTAGVSLSGQTMRVAFTPSAGQHTLRMVWRNGVNANTVSVSALASGRAAGFRVERDF